MKHHFQLTIGWLYPDLMSTYGDRGNIIVLQKRCQMRSIEAKIENISLETPLPQLTKCDLIFMGGAQDRQQKLVSEDFLKKKGPKVQELIEKGIPALFVCAAYQFVGHYYRPYQGEDILGAGIFDLYTIHPGDQAKRLIGNVAAQIISNFSRRSRDPAEAGQFPISNNTIVGFENHGGRTNLGKNIKPFAKVLKGFGNNGEDGYEGAIYKNAVGSYFHGPILPKNPHLADWLIKRALEIKYMSEISLTPLDDKLEYLANNFMLKKMGVV